jgi:hypothetical protein
MQITIEEEKDDKKEERRTQLAKMFVEDWWYELMEDE